MADRWLYVVFEWLNIEGKGVKIIKGWPLLGSVRFDLTT